MFVENNTTRAEEIQVPLRIVGFDGKEYFTETKTVLLAPGEVKQVYELSKLNFGKKAGPEKALLLVEIVKENKTIHSEPIYFTETKNLLLQNPNLKADYLQTENTLSIWVSSEKLAKNVVIEITNFEGTFNKNYVDIVPGRPVEFVFSADKLPHEAKPEIAMYSMFNATKRMVKL
ncbi:MAG TPA: hypothetical protein DCQ31_12485 [Bacteroidales bacterium]|nr:hypothetical protein [Bacteroidales bacterium]